MLFSRFTVISIRKGPQRGIVEMREPDKPGIPSPGRILAICINTDVAHRIKHALNHRCDQSPDEQEDSGVWRHIKWSGIDENELNRMWDFDQSSGRSYICIFQDNHLKSGSCPFMARTLTETDAQFVTEKLNHCCGRFRRKVKYFWRRMKIRKQEGAQRQLIVISRKSWYLDSRA
jgi:hypothetical protein